jgi:hypothetical protein
MRGYVVVFEGHDDDGYSAVLPRPARCCRCGPHATEPSDSDSVTVLNPSAA